MAAVAVAGVASAQVTITGKYAFGFTSDETNAGVATTGLGVTDGHLTFAASEDLGGGLSISASSEFVSRGRGTDIIARAEYRYPPKPSASGPLAIKKPRRVATAGFLIF
jgi:hypothetical protein